VSLQINNLVGFGGGGILGPVTAIDEGGWLESTQSTVHTFTNKTSDGPVTGFLISWDSGNSIQTLDSVTFDGKSCDILVQAGQSGGERSSVGIALIRNGATTGDIVLTFSGTVEASIITMVALTNLRSLIPIDIDDAGASSGTGDPLTALDGPGNDGIVLLVYINDSRDNATSWTPDPAVEEIADAISVTYRHSAAWHYGNPLSDIKAVAGSNDHHLVGASLR